MRLILGIIVLLLVVAFIVWRKKKRAVEETVVRKKRGDPAATSEFHAVSIRPGLDACSAARALEGERFLSEAAPPVPLPDCDSDDCRCRFVHYADRRSDEDRRSPYPATIGLDSGTYRREQRDGRDRRRQPPKSP